MAEALLSARGVGYSWDGAAGLDGVDLDLLRGEIRALLGPNGSGKSTLLRVLAGLLRPASGEVRLAGRPLGDLARREISRRVAWVPQEPPADVGFTVEEMVRLGRSPHLEGGLALEREEDRAATEAALSRVDLTALRARPFGALSGGERQRAVLARAIAQGADVLLLDEPAAFLDVRHQVGVYELLQGLARDEGKAVLTAMHDLNLAAAYADFVVLLDRGRAVASGAPAQALTYTRVREVYRADVYVGVNELTGAPYFLPMAGRRATR